MPTYEYECDRCKTRFERRQSVTEEPVRICPSCNGAVHKVYYPVGIVFKGSGFYSTDYGKAGASKSSNGNGSSAEKDSPKDSARDVAKDSAKDAGKDAKTESKKETVPAASSGT